MKIRFINHELLKTIYNFTWKWIIYIISNKFQIKIWYIMSLFTNVHNLISS